MSSDFCIGSFVTFDISGKKFEAVLTREIKMTNKDKYIPKVGENFKYKTNNCAEWMVANPAVLVTPLEVAWLDSEGLTQFVRIKYVEFKPMPAESIAEWQRLISIIKSNRYMYAGFTATEIQKAGFTIPKKVKRSELNNFIGDWCDNPKMLVDELCNLLGDLVENEA